MVIPRSDDVKYSEWRLAHYALGVIPPTKESLSVVDRANMIGPHRKGVDISRLVPSNNRMILVTPTSETAGISERTAHCLADVYHIRGGPNALTHSKQGRGVSTEARE